MDKDKKFFIFLTILDEIKFLMFLIRGSIYIYMYFVGGLKSLRVGTKPRILVLRWHEERTSSIWALVLEVEGSGSYVAFFVLELFWVLLTFGHNRVYVAASCVDCVLLSFNITTIACNVGRKKILSSYLMFIRYNHLRLGLPY